MAKKPEPTDAEYLRDLAERLMHIPVMYGTDQSDVDTLCRIARELEKKPFCIRQQAGGLPCTTP